MEQHGSVCLFQEDCHEEHENPVFLGAYEMDKDIAAGKWTKISRNQLFEAFQELVDDFDGEVFCERRNAAAINLSNVEFPNAVLFTFKSLRNRCVDIHIYCEKFGRNL